MDVQPPAARARIPLSVPHLTGMEGAALQRAVASNWIAPLGPEVELFEQEFAARCGMPAALATASGTAAIHLGLRVLGVGPGHDVLVSTLTFCASVNPILYQGARPVLVDSEAHSWNMDPAILAEELHRRGREGRLPAAVVVVHLFGQMADMGAILEECRRWSVPVLEDAAEALGASYLQDGAPRPAGTLGDVGAFSFDGSKMITTSMGGMLIARRPDLLAHARKLGQQAREPVPYYEHEEVGYNYRMSNLLAAFGRPQLEVLPDRVAARRVVFSRYFGALADLPGITFQAEAAWGVHSRWLTCIQVDPAAAGIDAETLRVRLLQQGIESRRVWKPMHLQPVYRSMQLPALGGAVSEALFSQGLCLPSSSSLTRDEVDEVCDRIRREVTRA